MKKLIAEVYRANLYLKTQGLVLHTWGNVSAIDRERGVIAIKPSGVPYESMKKSDIVLTDLDGKRLFGKLRPSSDLPTHAELYKAFPKIGAVAHTHSVYATAWAQAGRSIPFYGTTHADYFYGQIPCTRALTADEVKSDYEKNTGLVIAEAFEGRDPLEMPGVLVKSHGVFTWGKDAAEAAEFAATLEEVARMAQLTESLDGSAVPADDYLLDKHYRRKHGKHATYGQIPPR